MTRPLALALATAALAAPAAAQDWRPEPGDRAMVFTLPVLSLHGGGGSGTIGFWWQRTERTSLGLDFSGSLNQRHNETPAGDRTSQTASIGVTPALKRYLNDSGPTAPFFRAGVGAMVTHQWLDDPGGEVTTAWSLGAFASTAIGVDWFPTENIAIGGHAGISVSYSTRDHSENPYGSYQFGLATFTSGLRIQIYF